MKEQENPSQRRNNQQRKNPRPRLYSTLKYASLGFQMMGTILLGVIGGIKLDQWVSWDFPVFTIVLIILAVFLAIYNGIKDFIKR